MNTGITAAWKTDKGRRPTNEDACLLMTFVELGGVLDALIVVADGMGGRGAGEVASRIAVNTVRDSVLKSVSKGETDISGIMFNSVKNANAAVCREASSKPNLHGMGTTCAAVAVSGGKMYVAHMGDSRVYLLRNAQLRRMTEDHSIVAEKVRSGEITEEEARKSRFRNVITRAVGLDESAEPETDQFELTEGDIILVCTDGLTVPVMEAEITELLIDSEDVSDAARRLVTAALKNSGSDNITVAVAKYGSTAGEKPRRRERSPGHRTLWVLPLVLGLIIGILAGLYLARTHIGRLGGLGMQSPVISDLANIEYDDPFPLLYTPVQGRFLALDPQDNIYVVDFRGQLMKLDSTGNVINTFPTRDDMRPLPGGSAPLAATDRSGNLYVSDPIEGYIRKYDSNGLLIGNIGEDRLISPEALAVDAYGNIYVVDGGRLKVVRPK